MPSASAPLIAVTRQGDAAGELGQHLRALGAEIVELPLTHFIPALSAVELADLLAGLEAEDWLLLTSPQAARTTLRLAEKTQLTRFKVAAVGAGTARIWTAAGLSVDHLPSEATGQRLGLELPAGVDVKTLHLTSQRSEATLGEALVSRGIGYQRAVLYRTEATPMTAENLEIWRRVEAAALTAGSAAQALAAALTADFDPLGLPVAVMGEQSVRVARAVGFRRVVQADTPTLAALAEAAYRARSI